MKLLQLALVALVIAVSPMHAQVPKDLTTISCELQSVSHVRFSPNGKLLAIVGDDSIVLWDIAADKLKSRIKAGGAQEVVRFSAIEFVDDNTLVASSKNYNTDKAKVALWDIAAGKEGKTLLEEEPLRLVLSPDAKTLACAIKDTVRLIDAANGKEVQTLKVPASDFAFALEGKSLAVVHYLKEGHLYDIATGKEGAKLPISSSVKASADGKTLLLSALEDSVTIWDAVKNTSLRQLKPHTSPVYSLAMTNDARSAVTFESNNILRAWDVGTGKERGAMRLRGLNSPVFSRDRKRLAAIVGGKVLLWKMEDGTLPPLPPLLKEQSSAKLDRDITSMAVSADGKTVVAAVAGSGDQGVLVWDLTAGKKKSFLKTEPPVNRVAISRDGKLAAWRCEEDTTVYVGDCEKGEVKHKLKGHFAPIRAIAFSPESKTVAAAAQDGVIKVWDLKSGQEVASLFSSKEPVYALAYSPKEDNLLAAGEGVAIGNKNNRGTVSLWDVKTKKLKKRLKGQTQDVRSLAFSADGKVLAASAEDLRTWDLETGREKSKNPEYGDCYSLALSPEGKRVAAIQGVQLILLDSENGKETAFVTAHPGNCPFQGGFGMFFTHDGKGVMTGALEKNQITTWKVPMK